MGCWWNLCQDVPLLQANTYIIDIHVLPCALRFNVQNLFDVTAYIECFLLRWMSQIMSLKMSSPLHKNHY